MSKQDNETNKIEMVAPGHDDSSQKDVDSQNINSERDEEKKLNDLSEDISSDTPSASVLREVARLQLDNKALAKRVVRVWTIVLILVIGIISIFYSMIFYYPKAKYVNTSDNAGICVFDPKNDLDISDEDVMDFAKRAVLNSYSYDYVNYREKINSSANEFYTSNGRKSFFQQLDASNNLDRVRSGNLIQRSNATNSPQLEERDQGYQWWVVQIPMNIEFFSGGEAKPRTTLAYIATVRVQRIPPSKGKKLPLGIDSIYLKN